MSDFLIGLTVVAVIFLEIKVVKTGEKTKESFRKLLSIPTLLYASILLVTGMMHGISGYLSIYLQEEMGATPIIFSEFKQYHITVSYTHLTLPTTPYV